MPKDTPRISVSSLQQADIRKFLGSWSAQLQDRANQVRELIGSRHWLSDGRHKERLVEEFLKTHLPERCRFGNGFVLPLTAPDDVSREIDILVMDRDWVSPLLTSGDLVIVPPDGLIAHVHVKATLTAPSLTDALETAISAANACISRAGRLPLAGIFFFDHSIPLDDSSKLESLVKKVTDQLGSLLNMNKASDVVLAAGGDLFAVSKARVGSEPARLVFFKLPQLTAGAFLANVLTTTQTHFDGGSHRPQLLRAVAALAGKPIFTTSL